MTTTDFVTNIRELIEALLINPEFLGDSKWQERLLKAITPLDVEKRARGMIYAAARKELDTKAMKKHRRTGVLDPVTDEDIEKLFQEKWEMYLEKKAEEKAKQTAFAKAD